MNSRVIVSALVEKDGKFLFGRKAEGMGPYPDTWHLLGGGVDLEEESLVEAVKREVREEAGVEVKVVEKLGFGEDVEPDKNGIPTRYVFMVFRTRYLSGEPTPGDDIERLEWFSKEDLGEIDLNEPTLRLFSELGLTQDL